MEVRGQMSQQVRCDRKNQGGGEKSKSGERTV